MHELLIAVGVVLLVLVSAAAVGGWLLLHTLGRANRVVPNRRSPAPLTWLWSWRAAARLHRRLRRAIQVVSHVMAPFHPPPRGRRRRGDLPSVPFSDVAEALVARAAHLDERLVAVSGMALPWRAPVLAELGWAVADVEASVSHLERVGAAWHVQVTTATVEPFPPLDLHSRLNAVEAALAGITQDRAGANLWGAR